MSFKNNRLPLGVLAMLALAGPAFAAKDVTFGLQFGLAVPTSDLKTFLSLNDLGTAELGGGFGLNLQVDLNNGHVLRPRLETWAFQGQKTGFVTPKASLTSLGVDYLYFLEGSMNKGAYGVAGAGFSSNHLSAETLFQTVSGTSNKASYTLGGGYQFNSKWGLEARYTGTTYSKYGLKNSLDLGFVAVVASYRFN